MASGRSSPACSWLGARRIDLYRRRRSLQRRAQSLRARYREMDEAQHRVPMAWRRATAGARMTPDFLIIGAQKGGTTALHQYLCEHPQIVPAREKELHYFNQEPRPSLRGYREHFPLLPPRMRSARPRTFEASVSYLFHPLVPSRVRATLPTDVRLVVLLREPVERTVSQVRMGQRKGWERLSLLDALLAEDDRVAMGPTDADLRQGGVPLWGTYRRRSLYAEQLERWFEVFPREQFLILRSEDLRDDTQSNYDLVCDFVGLERHRLSSTSLRHVGHEAGVPDDVRAFLEPYFEAPNERLFELVGIRWDAAVPSEAR